MILSTKNAIKYVDACLFFNPIVVDNYAAFFNCTPVGRASDSMVYMWLFILVGWGRIFVSVAWPAHRGSTGVFL